MSSAQDKPNEESVAACAQRLRDIWALGEGPQVEEALLAYGCLPASAASTFEVGSWQEVVAAFHECRIDDQFVPPLVRVDAEGRPVGTVRDGDSVVYYDFRTDRAKPLTAAFLDVPFGGQVGGLSDAAAAARPALHSFVTMTHYDDEFTRSPLLREAFNPAKPLEDTYAEVAGRAGVRQLVSAESEKWRAVTWFKDGRRNLGYAKERQDGLVRTDRHPTLPITVRVVQSREVAAHIQAPLMRAKEITDVLLEGVRDGVEDIFANYANADMVGHAMTDVREFEGVVDAVTELDAQLERLVTEAVREGYVVMITGDHGNAEQMVHPDGKANPAHTTNKVPFVVIGLGEDERAGASLDPDMTIGDMAPATMHLRGLPLPASWDRQSPFRGGAIRADPRRRVMKLVLDGYGVRDDEGGNAMAAAASRKGSPLHMDRWMRGEDGALHARAEASGERCGYPAGEAGTTEFGHILFDAGRTVRSDVALIDHAMASGEFERNEALVEVFRHAKEAGSVVHLMGITSDGMVHSSLNHLDGLLRAAAAAGLSRHQVSVHFVTDGRDVPGDSSPKYFDWVERKLAEHGVGQINSAWGRGWGKDRDNRWRRIEAAFRSLTEGTGAMHLRFPDEKKE